MEAGAAGVCWAWKQAPNPSSGRIFGSARFCPLLPASWADQSRFDTLPICGPPSTADSPGRGLRPPIRLSPFASPPPPTCASRSTRSARSFENSAPKLPVDIVYGSVRQLLQPDSQRRAVRLYLSADAEYPRRLGEEDLIVEGSEFVYAIGRIVLWSPAGSSLGRRSKRYWTPPSGKSRSRTPSTPPTAAPRSPHCGRLASTSRSKRSWCSGENVAQALQFVQSGGADVGIVALALALAPTVRDSGRYWELPLDSYPRMEQSGAILRGARD